jgi:hypothetical protein
MKIKLFISGLIIWIACLIIRIIYLVIIKESNFSISNFIFGFKLSLFFFSPLLIVILFMQHFENKYTLLKKFNFTYSILIFGFLGFIYFSLAYNIKSNNNSEVYLESFYSLIAGIIYYLCNRLLSNKCTM